WVQPVLFPALLFEPPCRYAPWTTQIARGHRAKSGPRWGIKTKVMVNWAIAVVLVFFVTGVVVIIARSGKHTTKWWSLSNRWPRTRPANDFARPVHQNRPHC